MKTLPKFFDGVSVFPISESVPLIEISTTIEKLYDRQDGGIPVFIIEDRDNARIEKQAAEDFFEALRRLFRKPNGRVLVIWPVTKLETRDRLREVAWETGAESIVPLDTKGVYTFTGLLPERYFDVAETTAKSLNGEGLESFGISRDTGMALAKEVDTISRFYTRLEEESSKRRTEVWDILKEKFRPKVWIVLVGDDSKYIDATVTGLSQGRKTKVDIELLIDYLDDKNNDAIYLEEWRKRRSQVAFLMRTLDVRLLPFPSNAAVAAVRAFGSEKARQRLLKKNEGREACIEIIEKTRLYKAILSELGAEHDRYMSRRPPAPDTVDEYRRIQKLAASDDKPLNKAVGQALQAALESNGHNLRIVTEKRNLPSSTLQPDIQIWLTESELICVEPTWRTTGRGIENEISETQNSMTPGNIQKYLLGKVFDYVTSLKL